LLEVDTEPATLLRDALAHRELRSAAGGTPPKRGGGPQVAYLLQRLDAEPVLQADWLQEISGWCDRQYRIIDPATSPTARAVLVARLQGLATTGLVRAQQVARVIA